MANNLGGLVSKFTTRLDRVLEQCIKTGFLQINDAFLGDFVGVGEVKLPTFTIQGLGDYDRSHILAAPFSPTPGRSVTKRRKESSSPGSTTSLR